MAATPSSPAITTNDPGLLAQLGNSVPTVSNYDFVWNNLADTTGTATGDNLANIVPIPAYNYAAALPLSFPTAQDKASYPGATTMIVPDILRMRTTNTALLMPFVTAGDPTTGIGELRSYAKLDGGGVSTTGVLVPCYLNYVPGYTPADQAQTAGVVTQMVLTPVTRTDRATMWDRTKVYRLMLNSNLPGRVVTGQ